MEVIFLKSKKGPAIVLIITALILIVFLVLEVMPNKKESNITTEQTEDSMKEFRQKYDTKYLTITLKDNAKSQVIEEIAKKYTANLIESEKEISNYTIEFEKQLDSETALTVLESIMETEGVAAASYLSNEESQSNYFNSDNPENEKVFETAISKYQAPVSVYYDTKGKYTFLYPSAYVLSNENDVIDIGEGKMVIEPYKPSHAGMTEEVVRNIIGEKANDEIVKESYTMYDTDYSTVITWFDGEQYNAVVQIENGYYKFNATDEKEFNLLTESFYIN